MIGQQVLNPLVEMMLVVVDEYQVLSRIDDEFMMNGKQPVPGKIIAKPWLHHSDADVQEVSSIVEHNVRVVDDTGSDWSKMEKSYEEIEVTMMPEDYRQKKILYRVDGGDFVQNCGEVKEDAGRPAAESLGGGTSVRVGKGGSGRRPREGNDERVDDLNGQGNDQGMGANRGVEGVNRNVEGVNGGVGGAPDFPTIIAQQLQNLLPAMQAQVGNQGNVGNQNGNVVNENVQENVRNVLVNGNRVGCSYNEFLACNPKEYDGKGAAVVLTRWIEKMENVQDMSGCSNDQKVKYTAGSFVGKALTFYKLVRLVPHLVTPESRKIERYVYGLALQIRRMVAATEPKTIQKEM
ncbi:hypothetical protein Tco_1491103 [Tanacetum coccineum]